jgi:hypothetical protein
MAGDPCQLGPVVLSKLAKKHGLDVSAMERLIHVEPYTCNVRLPSSKAPFAGYAIFKLQLEIR